MDTLLRIFFVLTVIFLIAIRILAIFELNKLEPKTRVKWSKTVLWNPIGAFPFLCKMIQGKLDEDDNKFV